MLAHIMINSYLAIILSVISLIGAMTTDNPKLQKNLIRAYVVIGSILILHVLYWLITS